MEFKSYKKLLKKNNSENDFLTHYSFYCLNTAD